MKSVVLVPYFQINLLLVNDRLSLFSIVAIFSGPRYPQNEFIAFLYIFVYIYILYSNYEIPTSKKIENFLEKSMLVKILETFLTGWALKGKYWFSQRFKTVMTTWFTHYCTLITSTILSSFVNFHVVMWMSIHIKWKIFLPVSFLLSR